MPPQSIGLPQSAYGPSDVPILPKPHLNQRLRAPLAGLAAHVVRRRLQLVIATTLGDVFCRSGHWIDLHGQWTDASQQANISEAEAGWGTESDSDGSNAMPPMDVSNRNARPNGDVYASAWCVNDVLGTLKGLFRCSNLVLLPRRCWPGADFSLDTEIRVTTRASPNDAKISFQRHSVLPGKSCFSCSFFLPCFLILSLCI